MAYVGDSALLEDSVKRFILLIGRYANFGVKFMKNILFRPYCCTVLADSCDPGAGLELAMSCGSARTTTCNEVSVLWRVSSL
jgi:hypothetical protein